MRRLFRVALADVVLIHISDDKDFISYYAIQ